MKDNTSDIETTTPPKETPSRLQTTMEYIKEKIKNYIERQEKKFSQKQKLVFLWTLIALYGLCLIFVTYDAFVNNRPAKDKLGDIRPMTKPPQKQQEKEKSEKESQDTSKSDTIESDQDHNNPEG